MTVVPLFTFPVARNRSQTLNAGFNIPSPFLDVGQTVNFEFMLEVLEVLEVLEMLEVLEVSVVDSFRSLSSFYLASI